MSIILAITTELATLAICAFMICAGMMRTTGTTQQDSRNVQYVFVFGMLISVVIAGSHWIGW